MSHSPKYDARAWEDLNVAPVPLWVCCKVEAEQRCCHASTFLAAALTTAARSLQQPLRQHALDGWTWGGRLNRHGGMD